MKKGENGFYISLFHFSLFICDFVSITNKYILTINSKITLSNLISSGRLENTSKFNRL